VLERPRVAGQAVQQGSRLAPERPPSFLGAARLAFSAEFGDFRGRVAEAAEAPFVWVAADVAELPPGERASAAELAVADELGWAAWRPQEGWPVRAV